MLCGDSNNFNNIKNHGKILLPWFFILFDFEYPCSLYAVRNKEENGINSGLEQCEEPGRTCCKGSSEKPYKACGYAKLQYAENVVSNDCGAVFTIVGKYEALIDVEINKAGNCPGNKGAKPYGANTFGKCFSTQSRKKHMQQPECQKVYCRRCAG